MTELARSHQALLDDELYDDAVCEPAVCQVADTISGHECHCECQALSAESCQCHTRQGDTVAPAARWHQIVEFLDVNVST